MWIGFAVLAAVCFGLRGILYHAASKLPLSRTVLLCGTFTMGAIVSLAAAVLSGQTWTLSALVGIQMGLFSFIANASMFKGFEVGKASLVAIITALPPVLVVVLAYLFWNESLNGYQLAAFVVIVAGILLIRYSNDLAAGNWQGAQWALLALLMFAGNDLSGSWSTKLGAPLFPTLFYMFAAGAVCFALWWAKDIRNEAASASQAQARIAARETDGSGAESFDARGEAGEASGLRSGEQAGAASREYDACAVPLAAASDAVREAESNTDAPGKARETDASVEVRESLGGRPWTARRTFGAGMLVGLTNAAGMMLIVTAFGYGKAGLVSAVTALNVLIVLLYTRFVVKERFTRLEIAGMAGAFCGIVLLRLLGG
ncbi:EamA family transporter [Paenibacillus thailandensis]|uniref:EamA family transporter n=1 Tax=Paenibacillus thailandensis TaxID=393250 RepID=A0ABW5QVS9_9BACL